MNQDHVPFAQIVVEIGRLCKQKASGTLFITTTSNRSAQIALDNGEIVFIFFSSKRGEEALALMSTIREGRYRFQEKGVLPPRMALPPTEAILNILGQGAPYASPRQEESKAAAGGRLSQVQKDVLQSCLADCIGPMAAVICEDHLGADGSLAEIIDALAAEIPSAGLARKFRELVAARTEYMGREQSLA